MKTTKMLLSLLLALITLCSVISVPVSAASTTAFDILSSSNYAKTFTLSRSGQTIPYTNSNLNDRGTVTYGASSKSYIDNSTDELYIFDVGCTNGTWWAYVSYPVSSGRVKAYIPLSAITSNNAGHSKTTSTGKFYCSLREDTDASSKYYVAEGDTVYLISTSYKYQILYPISGGKWRLAWCSASDYQKYCGSTGYSDNTGNTINISTEGTTTNPASGSYARIRYSVNNRCLDVPSEAISNNGTQLQIWDYVSGNQNQIFQLTDTGKGWHITSLQSGKIIEVRDSSHEDCAQVAQWDVHDLDCARWDIVKNVDGTVSFRNRESGKYLNVYGGGDAGNGTKMIQYHDDNTYAMKFLIEPVDISGDTTTEDIASSGWQWPMSDYTVNQSFNNKRNSGSRPYHCGIDIKSFNTDIYAAADGTVVYKGYSDGNGNHVVISHNLNGTTVKTLYSHLSNYNVCPEVGQAISKGTQIGVMGSTGNSTGPHLHFAVYTGSSNNPWGYATSGGANKISYGGCVFYNPSYVITNSKLPS